MKNMAANETETQAAAVDETAQTTDAQPKKAKKVPMSEGQMDKITSDTGKMLAAQPKQTIKLYQTPPGENDLPDETVCINGYIYQIKRGEAVDVPQSVYEVLEQAGRL